MKSMFKMFITTLIGTLKKVTDDEEDYEYLNPSNMTITLDEPDETQIITDSIVTSVLNGIGANNVDENGKIISSVMSIFNLEDDDLKVNFGVLFIFFFTLRFLTYFLLVWRSHGRK